jgi:hypothetical protein
MKYSKTETGQQAFKQRSPLFSARQRSMFILCDGNKTLEQVLAATGGMGVTEADVDHLVDIGFLSLVMASVEPPVLAAAHDASRGPDGEVPAPDSRTPQQRYSDAKPIATQLTAALGLRGFRLNLAVESAAGFDDLLALLPKIQEAVGSQTARELERALKG